MHSTIIIAGAGPAGITAAYALSKAENRSDEIILLEATSTTGGISRTVRHGRNRIDIGGHRFFSKNEEVTKLWLEVMPEQTSPALDELLLGAEIPDSDTPADPEKNDNVMLRRRRVSRIFYLKHFFDYPVSLSLATIRGLGPGRTLKSGLGYIRARIFPRKENNMEDFYINRFGAPLYRMFFEDYTRKVWGVHPSLLGADWGAQRVKGLSLTAILKNMLRRLWRSDKPDDKVETSLIEEFLYPKYGPGQLWEKMAHIAVENGVQLRLENRVVEIYVGADRRIKSVVTEDASARRTESECTEFISSIPLKDLVEALRGIDIPDAVREAASALPYRDFITVGLQLDKLAIKNHTKLKTYAQRIPDTWIYVQEKDVRMGRIQVFNNWSPYMVGDYRNKMWIGLEYFCKEGDELWTMPDEDLVAFAAGELVKTGIINASSVIEDSICLRVPKAYPGYFGSYASIGTIRDFLDTIPNLWCIGRNGQHRYNNMDHSMLTGLEAADAITSGSRDKTKLWNVNTESEYHESR